MSERVSELSECVGPPAKKEKELTSVVQSTFDSADEIADRPPQHCSAREKLKQPDHTSPNKAGAEARIVSRRVTKPD